MENNVKLLRRSTVTVFASLLLSVTLIAGCGTSTSPSASQAQSASQDVNIGYVPILSMAPAMVADQKGFIDQQGLKAHFFSFPNGPDLYKALASGKLDFAYAGVPAAVDWASRGAKMKVIAKVDTGKFGLLVKQSSTIAKPTDLKGKKIGTVVQGSGVDLLVRGFLLPEAGLTQQDVTLDTMDMANMGPAITNGTIDAAVAGEPFLSMDELRGLKVIKELPDPGIVLIAPNSFLKQHADVVKKFMTGYMASIQFMNQHQKQTANILANSFKVPSITSLGKTYTPAEVIEKALRRNTFDYRFTDADYTFYQQVADADYKLKLIDHPFTAKTLIDPTWTNP